MNIHLDKLWNLIMLIKAFTTNMCYVVFRKVTFNMLAIQNTQGTYVHILNTKN